jgi:hypothetical protein
MSGRRGNGAIRFIAAAALAAAGSAACAAFDKPDWDQAANIKDAALRLAQLQRTKGANGAFDFIDACYRTQGLNSKYTKGYEACIAQDYLETQVLALVYSRLPPESLKKLGAPTPQILADSMTRRINQAFASYQAPKSEVERFKKLVDEEGFPVFFEALFPNAKSPKLDAPKPDSPGTKQN